MNSQNNGSSLLGAPQSTISPWLEEPGGYHEQRLAKRPRDWRADYTPRFGIASLLPGRDLSDYSDSTRRSPNPLLAYTGSSSIPALLHDLRQDPFVFIQFPAMGRQHNTLDYAQQATNPPTNFMRLYHPKFPWYIDIEQSHPNGVTVHDVLGQLYLQMLKLITPRHFYNQVLGEGDRHQINNAFRQRCSGHPELITRGVVQVDFFAIEGKFMWLGLAKGKNGMWEIKMQ
ncbi:hypothetical protein C8J56DRAFT_785645 [Mycena floridula]|nr:hypothetical protein C8J56DRAFT_785645 [Mycena floridula]